MHNHRAFLSLLVSVVALSGPAIAAPIKANAPGSGAGRTAPPDYVSQVDGPLAFAASPDGKTWAVWALRAPGEFDVAISSREQGGTWTSPTYVGRRNRTDEVDPSVVVDQNGTVYVAFTTRGSAKVAVSVLLNGSTTWLGPVIVSGNARASFPTIRIVADQVVVAYRTPAGVGLANLPLLIPAEIFGIQDGPEGVDPLGMVPRWNEKGPQPDRESDQEPNESDGLE